MMGQKYAILYCLFVEDNVKSVNEESKYDF
jgi:hypothetical protein